MSDIPQKIFLNCGQLNPSKMSLMSWGRVEWSDEEKDGHNIEYIRYDLYRNREQELSAQIKYLIAENSMQNKED